MSRFASTCHIGVTFYTHRHFPTQWAIVLADNPLFEGQIWCSSPAETTIGWCASWTLCELSPAAGSGLNLPVGLFSGIVHIAQVAAPIDTMRTWIAQRNFASEFDRYPVYASDDIPYGADKYVLLALWRLCEGRYISLRRPDLKSLAKQIRGRFLALQHAQLPLAMNYYPVVSLEDENGTVVFGRFTPR
ncbi:hypothetical protein BC827DRAFT_259805 [Russula dissimulans]|nr:hypothetical protein BC827DRAFT_259805 [Russula dissimulans]